MTSLRINPLELPEIRSAVGQYLSRPDLARCLRVCKSWHASFVPLVWSTAHIYSYPSDNNPPLETFIRCSHYIKDLHLNINAPQEYMFTPCPNLLRLRVNGYWSKKSEGADIVPIEIAQYEQLCYLSINGHNIQSQRIIWRPIHYHSLSELELRNLEIEPTCTATFWDLCTQLVSLKIEEVTVAAMPARSIAFDRLQHLELELKSQTLEHQLDWITQCPNLTSLKWRSNGSRLASDFAEGFIPGTSTWDSLRELMLARFEFADGQLAWIIGVMRELRALNVNSCRVGSRSLKALCLHSQSLRSLDIATCDVITPSFVPGVLASFPHLEFLAFDSVMSQDIIDGPPWACGSSLTKLTAGFQFIPDQDNQYLVYHQRQVLQKVSRLTNLKELHLIRGRYNTRSLDLRLETGLDHLVTLKQLETFSLFTGIYCASVRDVEWMIDNWKNLKKFNGNLKLTWLDDKHLTAKFQAAGIQCSL
ncbi:MAG: hypothetical protein J3Q66DRAFT_352697 [Benniella sp.]|nr:MAG: hypothetical protein J3Q66DRAFT_352697 [Benniella sp.]